jgi:hypothetical protein
LKHALGLGPPSADHFDALHSALVNCSGQTRLEVQRRSRCGQLLAEVGQLRQQNRNVLERIRADATVEEEKRTAKRYHLAERARRLDANSAIQRERLYRFATTALAEKLEELLPRFQRQSKIGLVANASSWYQNKLTEAIRKIEKEADGALLSLAGENLQRPDSFTIQERMILNARLNVAELPSLIADAGPAVVAVIGGIVGTFVFPGAGTMAGAWLGNLVGSKLLGQIEPNYVPAYTEQARAKWDSDTRDILKVLQGQIDSRLTNLEGQVQDRLKAAQARPLSVELLQRESLEAGLIDCERALKSP